MSPGGHTPQPPRGVRPQALLPSLVNMATGWRLVPCAAPLRCGLRTRPVLSACCSILNRFMALRREKGAAAASGLLRRHSRAATRLIASRRPIIFRCLMPPHVPVVGSAWYFIAVSFCRSLGVHDRTRPSVPWWTLSLTQVLRRSRADRSASPFRQYHERQSSLVV
jgi:hypothetical protein